LNILVNHDIYQILKQYLEELVENAYTGCWAKEVVLRLFSEIE